MTENPKLKNQKSVANNQTNQQKSTDKVGLQSKDSSGGKSDRSNNSEPSPWLAHPLDPNPCPHQTASFVEYLRWMREPNRSPNNQGRDPTDPTTKAQIMQIAEEKANYQARLIELNNRTKLLAGDGNYFEVNCPWRIRVGGTKGPEEMLLPAFDNLGIPYIPSSSLRGVARSFAIRYFMKAKRLTWEDADRHVEQWFGHLEGEKDNRVGKVIFFDAYPIPCKSGGLAMDMANSIWRWEGDKLGKYSPNPNAFFSLKNVSFLIGIRPTKPNYEEQAKQVREWLIAGLAQGVGSQVNSGYGVLQGDKGSIVNGAFLELEFDVKGQKIHGAHRFSNLKEPFKRNKGNLKPNMFSEAEVRSTALKNMMRYWFRVFACGVLPPHNVKALETKIFGSIEPKPSLGWLCVRVEEIDPPEDSRNTQSGILRLFPTVSLPNEKTNSFQSLCKELCWLMFRLGGVGQGARRPYYERQGNPRIRGSDLTPYSRDNFWQVPDRPNGFAELFRQRLIKFYQSLEEVSGTHLNFQQPTNQPTQEQWNEVADRHCVILIFQGQVRNNKSHALAVLHSNQFKHNGNYDRFLCGGVGKDVIPSPVWIANIEDKNYQVVTVFGATADPRSRFVNELIRRGAIQIFPLK
jgi:CRISPR-associated protein Cmr6